MKKHISPTQINTYLRCGQQYFYRYIEGLKLPPGIAAIRGSSVHKGSEFNFKQKLNTRIDLPKKDIVDYSVSSYEEKIKTEGVWLNEEEESTGKEKVIGVGKDATVRLTGLYSEKVAPKYQPKEVETEQIIELRDDAFDLKGIVDLIDDKGWIVDLKTGTRTRTQDQVDRDLQFGFYSLLVEAKTGTPPSGIVVEQLLDKKTPESVPLVTKRDKKDYEIVVNKVNSVITGVKQGVFLPASEGSWWCSPMWCGYYSQCPYVRGKK